MLTTIIAMLTSLSLLSVAATTVHARENWRQTCSGAEYVCGSQAKTAKSAKTKASAPIAWDFGDAPVKKGKAKKAASFASQDYGSGSSYQSGKASWYGGRFHGRKTASGETYNMNSLTAAHRSLPFGTRVRVTNTRTGGSVVVRINDRGPFIAGRIIDLSRAAASQIGLTSSGVASVKVDVLGKG